MAHTPHPPAAVRVLGVVATAHPAPFASPAPMPLCGLRPQLYPRPVPGLTGE